MDFNDFFVVADYMAVEPPVIRRTIHNNIVPELPPLPDFSYHHQAMEPGTYGSHGWENNGLRTSGRGMIDMESRRRESRPEYVTYSVLNEARTRPNMSTARNMHAYIDLDAVDEPLPISKTPLNAGIRARLDTVSVQSHQSHGIFANSKSKALVSPGHRIVVSNLHAAVTQEDITVSCKIILCLSFNCWFYFVYFIKGIVCGYWGFDDCSFSTTRYS